MVVPMTQEECVVPMAQEQCDDSMAQDPTIEDEPTVEPTVEPSSSTQEQPSTEPYVLLGTLKLTPNDNVICIGEVQLEGGVHIYGGINLEVDRIENNTLYGVKIKKG